MTCYVNPLINPLMQYNAIPSRTAAQVCTTYILIRFTVYNTLYNIHPLHTPYIPLHDTNTLISTLNTHTHTLTLDISHQYILHNKSPTCLRNGVVNTSLPVLVNVSLDNLKGSDRYIINKQ